MLKKTNAETEHRSVFIAWALYQRRQESMAEEFGFETIYLGKSPKHMVKKVLAYTRMWWETFSLARRRDVAVIWLQVPPSLIVIAAILGRMMSTQKPFLIADCHNATFRPPWCRVPGFRALNRCDIVLVHNKEIAREAIALGLVGERLMVLEDAPAAPGGVLEEAFAADELPMRWFLFPASFAKDEPITEILEVARRCDDVGFIITGNPREDAHRDLVENAPKNVRFTGFVTIQQLDWLLTNCTGVLAQTRLNNVQLSACNEAVGFGKPMVVSDTNTLREIFTGAGAVFVNSADVSDIARGVREVCERLDELLDEARDFKQRRWRDWREGQAAPVHNRIRGGHTNA